jgi:hypothetical protein
MYGDLWIIGDIQFSFKRFSFNELSETIEMPEKEEIQDLLAILITGEGVVMRDSAWKKGGIYPSELLLYYGVNLSRWKIERKAIYQYSWEGRSIERLTSKH